MVDWLEAHGLAFLFWAILLLLVYRFARPLIHRLLVGVFRAQAATLGSEEAQKTELDKRVKTLEDLLSRALRLGVIVAGVLVVIGLFDLWPIFAGLGLLAAALTLAGQSIVLDYLMGFLILVEASTTLVTSSIWAAWRAPSRRSASAGPPCATRAAPSTRSPTA